MSRQLNFSPPQSFVDSSFFVKLTQLKLDVLKLDQSPRLIYGYYSYKTLGRNQTPSISLNDASFGDIKDFESGLPVNNNLISSGHITVVNTLEEFKDTNKLEYLKHAGQTLYDKIVDHSVLEDPSIFSEFSILSFADLKKYKFYYWFAFPQLNSEWEIISLENEIGTLTIDDTYNQPFGIIKSTGEIVHLKELFDYPKSEMLNVLFIDTSTQTESPSYVLKNFLTALSFYGYESVKVTVYRFNHLDSSFTVTLKNVVPITEVPRISGWERTSQGKLGPKLADLGSLIDPALLADQAIDLNLKLMKWRIAPELDLDLIKNTKCLLLGSGTLGSYIGRALLGWGVRKITFVDNGKVSFSNPVRQPLYNFEDCLNGGKWKAETAAESMKQIFPLVDAQGFNLEVPMAGHPITNESKQKNDFETLHRLIKEHDAIFLLMDSRETRWLPTIMGNVENKIVINAALGFESYLVMRHGCIDPKVDLSEQTENRLGCYFCNDVYAPSDSTTDRTLDQMCTVTRPGVALMASSLAVELLVSILQHPNRQWADHTSSESSTVLGSLPHQLRGFLHNFELLKLSAKNYKHCSACSTAVIEEFATNGWEFVKLALEDSKYIERLTGLDEVHKMSEEADLNFDVVDSEDEFV
ncbi:hypothetical protein CANARDRAFT_28901 [[Candida] arabinofermentans NRRL YB-2248]|uniref:Ubiquitin-like modifier-activating enzyme ATG7 n=1 Tax=[Candida] arabinofermentans NRRL YB-2248 TaxID=983967 RepID=A0A1E4SZ71_9ASCO|nr:hypothetical protein CANARDRAFT_28901 [[Candida] arabinofermentans NRRL YB-2248]